MLKNIVLQNRSYRRFHGGHKINCSQLKELIELARICPSASNLQPLRYLLSCDEATNNLIFPHLKWAGYLKDWVGPAENERPSAYIVVLTDSSVSKDPKVDCGIAAQTILLGAAEKGLGGCMIASVEKSLLAKALKVPDKYEIMLVIALGKPKEKIILEDILKNGSIEYWRDASGEHHVPKRRLDDIIL